MSPRVFVRTGVVVASVVDCTTAVARPVKRVAGYDAAVAHVTS